MTARQVPVEGRVHKTGVVERDQQAHASKRVRGRPRNGDRAPVAQVGRVEDGIREDRGREKTARSTMASQRDACHERTGCHRRRGQAPDRPPVPYRRDPLPQSWTARTRNDGDVHPRVEVANRPPMIIRPRSRHHEQL
jgi:hypothetical protein